MATPGAFGKPAHKRPVERPTWEWASADGNTIIQYFGGMVPPNDTPDLSALARLRHLDRTANEGEPL